MRAPHTNAAQRIFVYTLLLRGAVAMLWSEVPEAITFPSRSDVSAVILNDAVYLCGGEYYTYNFTVYGDTWAAPLQNGTLGQWRMISVSSPWSARAYHGGDIFPTPVPTWIISGGGRCIAPFVDSYCGSNYRWEGDVWATPDGANWTCVASSGNVTYDVQSRHTPGERERPLTHFQRLRSTVASDAENGSICAAPQLNLTTGAPREDGAVMWCPRGGHTFNVVPYLGFNAIVLTGGLNNTAQYADVWRSLDGGATWAMIAAPAPWPARSFHAVALMTNGSMVMTGGGSFTVIFNDVWASHDAGLTWILVTPAAQWVPRYAHTMVFAGGALVVSGGYVSNTLNGTGSTDVWTSTDAATWTCANAASPWPERSFHSSLALPGAAPGSISIAIIGGWVLRAISAPQLYEYFYFNDTWLAPLLPLEQHG